jgi:surfactin family lipopeptide synthetase A
MFENTSKVNNIKLNSQQNGRGHDSIAKHEKFWHERLASLQPIAFPYVEQTRSLLSPPRFERRTMVIIEEVASCLKKQNPDCNLGDLISVAFVGYLARLSGTDSFDLGFRDGQLTQELKSVIGLTSYVPCRLTITLEQGFREFFTTTQEQIEQTRKHQTYARDLVTRSPALKSIFAQSPPDVFPVAIERVNEISEVQSPPVNELTLSIPNHDPECVWFHNTEAVQENNIAKIIEQFTIFLQGITQDEAQPLAYIPLLSELEANKILLSWNDTAVDYPRDKCVHQLFEAQVEKTPNAVAVVYEEEQLSYQELNQRANQLAAYLQELGVQPETLVGICVERSLEMMVGLLGILKAGGAYVPLDPNYPQERLQYKLQDSAISLLLTQQKLLAKLPNHSAEVICLDLDWHKIAQYITETIESGVQPNNLAYVIYTSGSTGKPKGVQIEHHSVINFLTAMARSPGLEAQDTLLSVTTISFDIHVLELFLPLSLGAKVIIASREIAMNGHLLIQALEKHQVTLLQSTPITWRILLAAGWQGSKSLKMLTGGEPLSKELAKQLENKGASLWNLYGPTEATVWSSVEEIKADQETISIGRPLANVKYYILDKNLMPVPVGIPGELYIGGDSLARCYQNRPELTQEKFIRDPFSNQPNALMYKTGDLVRYLATLKDTSSRREASPIGHDGKIEYLGRIDAQVKIRGFRVELGEIEAAIALQPGVKQTVVIAREDNPGDKRLVAYVVLHPGQIIASREIRQFIGQKLPEYMIPRAFVVLETFPLTPNGKIDLNALPAAEFTRDLVVETFVPPRNSVELQLTKIWQEVLGIEGVGIRDDFFELGGESLQAVRLFTEIEQQFQQKLFLSTIFQASTIEQLARVLEEKESLPDSSYLVPIQPSGTQVPFFCIHGAQGEVLFLRDLAAHLHRDQPFYAIRSPGQNGEIAPLTSVKAMAQFYLQEIRAIQPEGAYLLGGYSFGGLVAFEMAQQLREKGQEVALLALFDCYAPGSLQPLALPQRLLRHLRNAIAIGPGYVVQKLKTFRTRSLYRLFRGASLKNDYFQHLTSTQYFYNLINEFPNFTIQDLEHWDNLYQANVQAGKNYLPSVYEGQISVFRVKIDPLTWFNRPVANCGWSELSQQAIKIYDCDGDHYTFMEEPYVQGLAAQLQAAILSATSKLKSLKGFVN